MSLNRLGYFYGELIIPFLQERQYSRPYRRRGLGAGLLLTVHQLSTGRAIPISDDLSTARERSRAELSAEAVVGQNMHVKQYEYPVLLLASR